MALDTFSAFYFDYEISSSNNILNIDEGAGEVAVEISVGSYSATDLGVAVENALNASLTNVYSVLFNRTERTFTISADAAFDLLIASGTQVGVSAYPALGFTGPDLTGLLTYTGNLQAGKEYLNQFKLQDYVNPEMDKRRISPSVNESASGDLEVVSFGFRSFITFSLKYITDKPGDGFVIKTNQNGFADLVEFLSYLTTKGPFEFMPDIDNKNIFFTCSVESLDSSSDGTSYKITELVNRNLPGYFEVNNIVCRVIE
jgi:hypothetical protein